MSSELSNEKIKQRVLLNYGHFVSDLDGLAIVDWLIGDRVITRDKWATIKAEEQTERCRNRRIIDWLLETTNPTAFISLRNALLKEDHWLVQLIDQEVLVNQVEDLEACAHDAALAEIERLKAENEKLKRLLVQKNRELIQIKAQKDINASIRKSHEIEQLEARLRGLEQRLLEMTESTKINRSESFESTDSGSELRMEERNLEKTTSSSEHSDEKGVRREIGTECSRGTSRLLSLQLSPDFDGYGFGFRTLVRCQSGLYCHVIDYVDPGSPAKQVGLQANWLITGVNGKSVRRTPKREVIRQIKSFPARVSLMITDGEREKFMRSTSSGSTTSESVMDDPKLSRDESITQNRVALLHSLDVNPILLAELLGNGVLEEATKQHILSGTTRICVNENFLNWLMNCSSEAMGKVMDALRKDDQGHLVNLIEGRQGDLPLSPLTRTQIYKISRDLADNMRVDYGLLDYLVSKQVLNMRHCQTIRSKSTDSEQSFELIEIVLRRSERTLNSLLSGLEETGQKFIADQIRLVLARSRNQFGNETPELLQTFRPLENSDKVLFLGLAIIDNHLYTISRNSSKIIVYNTVDYRFVCRFNLKALVDPWDIAACSRHERLYIMNCNYQDSHQVLVVDSLSGKLIKTWSPESVQASGISVTKEHTVLLTISEKNQLLEYRPDGDLIRKLQLSPDLRISQLIHAIKLDYCQYVISYSEYGKNSHRVSVVSDDDSSLLHSFGSDYALESIDGPLYMTVDEDSSVIVTDYGNGRVLLLNFEHDFRRILIGKQHGLRLPYRVCLDKADNRLFVIDCEYCYEKEQHVNSSLLIFQMKKT